MTKDIYRTLTEMKAKREENKLVGELLKIMTDTASPTMDTPMGRTMLAAAQFNFNVGEALQEHIEELELVVRDL